MALPNHNNPDLTIYEMVRNRLPFLEDNTTNETILSNFTLEAMHQLETCFKVRFVGEVEDWSRVGDEANYTVMQKSIIADVVSVYVLSFTAAINANPTAGSQALGTFLSKAKAGSAEVEYGQFDIKKTSVMYLNAENLIEVYKKAAVNKGLQIGCLFDMCDDCSIMWLDRQLVVPPFIVITSKCS
jgi:hypothetical protein